MTDPEQTGSEQSTLYLTELLCTQCGTTTNIAHRGEPTAVDQDAPWPDVSNCPKCCAYYPDDLGEAIVTVHEAEIDNRPEVRADGGTERCRCNCDDPVVGRELAGPSGLKREYCGRCKKLIREVEADLVTDGGTKYGDMLEGHEWDSPEDEGTGWRERTTAEADLEVTLHDEGYQTDRRWTVHIRRGHRGHPVAVYAAEHQNKGNFWREPELWRDAVDFVELPLAVRKRVASMLNRPVDEITPEVRMVHREDGTGVGDRAGESGRTCEVCGGRIHDDESDTHEACEAGDRDE